MMARGRFLKRWGKEEGPRYTRIGGVVFVDENLREYRAPYARDWKVLAFHDTLVMHNPFATHPIPEDVWATPRNSCVAAMKSCRWMDIMSEALTRPRSRPDGPTGHAWRCRCWMRIGSS